jgi:hypothetical protein
MGDTHAGRLYVGRRRRRRRWIEAANRMMME